MTNGKYCRKCLSAWSTDHFAYLKNDKQIKIIACYEFSLLVLSKNSPFGSDYRTGRDILKKDSLRPDVELANKIVQIDQSELRCIRLVIDSFREVLDHSRTTVVRSLDFFGWSQISWRIWNRNLEINWIWNEKKL